MAKRKFFDNHLVNDVDMLLQAGLALMWEEDSPQI